MRAGAAAVCPGQVVHRRRRPTEHEFAYPVSFVWLDPDRPEELCGAHPLWSATHVAPARFRRSDYGVYVSGSLADGCRAALGPMLGRRPAGEVRMLTQVRRWGWLFNPITVYMVWDADPDVPVGAVLEVTNTPWKERHRYPLALTCTDDGWLTAQTDKRLHVSPFLDESFRYDLRLRAVDDTIDVELDVIPSGTDVPVVQTAMSVGRLPATRRALGHTLRTNPLSTHRVSLGIHVQALRLWLKRVPFVRHPGKRVAAT